VTDPLFGATVIPGDAIVVRDTTLANPFRAFTVTVEAPVAPGLIVRLEGLAVIVKSG